MKKINEKEFDKAVEQTIEDTVNNKSLEGMAAFFIPLIGTIFAKKVKENLFSAEKSEADLNDFNEAVEKATDEALHDNSLNNEGRLFIQLIGSCFASDVSAILFRKDGEENGDK